MNENTPATDHWQRASDYAIKFGPWIIVRGRVGGEDRFNLYRGDKIMLGGRSTAQECKDYVTKFSATAAQDGPVV